MVFKTVVQLANKRVPLIKFRYGVNSLSASGGHSAQPVSPVSGSAPMMGQARASIEDWELPPRYRRKPMDAAEIAYINNGGPL